MVDILTDNKNLLFTTEADRVTVTPHAAQLFKDADIERLIRNCLPIRSISIWPRFGNFWRTMEISIPPSVPPKRPQSIEAADRWLCRRDGYHRC